VTPPVAWAWAWAFGRLCVWWRISQGGAWAVIGHSPRYDDAGVLSPSNSVSSRTQVSAAKRKAEKRNKVSANVKACSLQGSPIRAGL
jgi:hypothetical protein